MITKLTNEEIEQLNDAFSTRPIIKNWQDYYKYHKLSMNDEICITSTYHMTMYHILINYLKLKPLSSMLIANKKMDSISCKRIIDNNTILIHLVGCVFQKEFATSQYWNELLYLLPGYDFHIMLFGNDMKIPQKQCEYLAKQSQISEAQKQTNQSFYLNQNKRYHYIF